MFEKVCLFSIVEMDYHAPAGAVLEFYTGTPTDAITLRETLVIPASLTRRTVKLRLKSTTKGKQYKVRVTSVGFCVLYGGRVYARTLGAAGAAWAWYSLPITPTANVFSQVKLPIVATADRFSQHKLPIVATADRFSQHKLPIVATGDKFTAVKIPLHPTGELTEWQNIPVAK